MLLEFQFITQLVLFWLVIVPPLTLHCVIGVVPNPSPDKVYVTLEPLHTAIQSFCSILKISISFGLISSASKQPTSIFQPNLIVP